MYTDYVSRLRSMVQACLYEYNTFGVNRHLDYARWDNAYCCCMYLDCARCDSFNRLDGTGLMCWLGQVNLKLSLLLSELALNYTGNSTVFTLLLYPIIQRTTSCILSPVYSQNSSIEISWCSFLFRCFLIFNKYNLACAYSFPIMHCTSFGYMHTLVPLVITLFNYS